MALGDEQARRRKIIICSQLVESAAATARNLAAGDLVGGTDEEQDALIEALEKSAELIEGSMPAPAAD